SRARASATRRSPNCFCRARAAQPRSRWWSADGRGSSPTAHATNVDNPSTLDYNSEQGSAPMTEIHDASSLKTALIAAIMNAGGSLEGTFEQLGEAAITEKSVAGARGV